MNCWVRYCLSNEHFKKEIFESFKLIISNQLINKKIIIIKADKKEREEKKMNFKISFKHHFKMKFEMVLMMDKFMARRLLAVAPSTSTYLKLYLKVNKRNYVSWFKNRKEKKLYFGPSSFGYWKKSIQLIKNKDLFSWIYSREYI